MKTMNCHIRYAIILLLMTSSCFFVSHSFNIDNAPTTSFHKTLCLPDQASALLQFKHEFAFHKLNYSYEDVPYHYYLLYNGYPKMKFWKAEKDCCYWDGVSCNMETGHVESLDLSHSWLHGPLLSNSSLFNLHQLQRLNLAFNNFSFSAIPSELGRLSRLTHLNLSSSFFCGHIPSGIFWLNKLISLDLSYNYHWDPFKGDYIYLQRVDMITRLVKNMTNIREILLNSVDLSSSLPESLANLSSLESLSLSGCYLHGRFPNNIFLLPKLKVIDLSRNDIFTGFHPKFHNGSNLRSLILSWTNLSARLPDSIGNLKSLNVLDISYCDFSGTLPFSFWNLSELTELYLSGNNFGGINQLLPRVGKLSKLTILELHALQLSGEVAFSLGNLTRLEILGLSENNFSGQIPFSFPNLKMLRSLDLQESGVSGNIPSSFGDLIRLEDLNLSINNLSGQIPPSIGNLSRLESFDLSNNGLSGPIPPSIGKLIRLDYLYLRYNNLSGPIPPSIGKLTRLEDLELSYNNLSGQIPPSLGNLSQLAYLDISSNCFEGVIHWSLFAISSLEGMYMSDNQFSGPLNIQNISSSQLVRLDISGNMLNGEIPKSISKLRNVEWLKLGSNNLSGTVELDTFSSLRVLDLSSNNISKLSYGHDMASILLNLAYFNLSSCNITEFPEFLKSQHELQRLDLSHNKIEGPIPKWFLSVSINNLFFLDLSHNFISGWEVAPSILPWNELRYLNLHSNKLQGPLVVPPEDISYYIVSNNNLTGGIHPFFCKLKDLGFFDVSNNFLAGIIPHCMGQLCVHNSSSNFNLMTLDLSNNRLHGKVPHSLSKCQQLEILNLGHNEIEDTFPSWLPELSELQVLVLRSNKFYGPVWHPHSKVFGFRKLRIIDLSFNEFNGTLPPDYFKSWSSMMQISNKDNSSQLKYMEYGDSGKTYYHASLKVIDKGIEIVMVKIITIFTSIDLSNNRFEGEIPISLRNLQSLVVLNLSSNSFTGPIPSSFSNLGELESLDLSKNKLSGRIPPQFAKLTFLEYLNLSHNNLTGPIPQGGQMETFQASAFEGNFGLCGLPLPKKCDDIETPTSQQDQESDSGYDFGWRVVALGYGCGFLIGMVAGHFIISKRPNWFSKTFGVNIQRPR
ncbi:receptor-like protein 7 [Ziziphus jujuba]|uniref:Receptor-like protein 7 n=1 Tax=Ziziphus jujuba TaxID=326968 RepID=A0A6P4AMV6_ZIZJJ|nr:receptor-like protein 7 [Ziziphus jujuba]